MIQHDMIQWNILMCTQKLTSSQLNLPHGNKQRKNNEETKNKKRRRSEETVQYVQLTYQYHYKSAVGHGDYDSISHVSQWASGPPRKSQFTLGWHNSSRHCHSINVAIIWPRHSIQCSRLKQSVAMHSNITVNTWNKYRGVSMAETSNEIHLQSDSMPLYKHSFMSNVAQIMTRSNHPSFNQKAPQGGCGHRRQHARLR